MLDGGQASAEGCTRSPPMILSKLSLVSTTTVGLQLRALELLAYDLLGSGSFCGRLGAAGWPRVARSGSAARAQTWASKTGVRTSNAWW